MRNLRKITAFLLAVVMLAGMLVVPEGNVEAARKKVQLSKKTVTLEVGKKVTLKLKNAPKKKKITWSSSNKKVASVSKKGVVTAEKAGKANITAKVSGKKYVCKVTVKKKTKQVATTEAATTEATTQQATTTEAPKQENPTTPDKPSDSDTPATPADNTLTNTEGKNPGDVAALQEIIKEQNAKGARLSTDANQYSWNENGRLVGIAWIDCNIQNTITLEKLPTLTTLDCARNSLSNLDVSKNTSLIYLYCSMNKLSSLDVTNNKKLDYLEYDEDQVKVIGWKKK